jgi:hypothetical protein
LKWPTAEKIAIAELWICSSGAKQHSFKSCGYAVSEVLPSGWAIEILDMISCTCLPPIKINEEIKIDATALYRLPIEVHLKNFCKKCN